MRRRNSEKTVVAQKSYYGVTVGFIVGWPMRFGTNIRNIRADLIFETELDAKKFQRELEELRRDPMPDFEII